MRFAVLFLFLFHSSKVDWYSLFALGDPNSVYLWGKKKQYYSEIHFKLINVFAFRFILYRLTSFKFIHKYHLNYNCYWFPIIHILRRICEYEILIKLNEVYISENENQLLFFNFFSYKYFRNFIFIHLPEIFNFHNIFIHLINPTIKSFTLNFEKKNLQFVLFKQQLEICFFSFKMIYKICNSHSSFV